MFLKLIQQGRTTVVQCDSIVTRLRCPHEKISGETPLADYLIEIEVRRIGQLEQFYEFDRDKCMTNNIGGEAGVWLMNDNGKTVDTIFSTS